MRWADWIERAPCNHFRLLQPLLYTHTDEQFERCELLLKSVTPSRQNGCWPADHHYFLLPPKSAAGRYCTKANRFIIRWQSLIEQQRLLVRHFSSGIRKRRMRRAIYYLVNRRRELLTISTWFGNNNLHIADNVASTAGCHSQPSKRCQTNKKGTQSAVSRRQPHSVFHIFKTWQWWWWWENRLCTFIYPSLATVYKSKGKKKNFEHWCSSIE